MASSSNKVTTNDCVCIEVDNYDELKESDHPNPGEPEVKLHVHPSHLFSVHVQSPIAFEHEHSKEYDHFEPLEFHGHWDSEGKASFTNSGYTVTLRFHNRSALPTLRGGPLHADFTFEQLHFHWSEDDDSGCEHIFEGRAYSMEAHAVHYNSRYGSFQEAATKPDGLAVVAFFLQSSGDEDNEEFKKMSDAVKNVVKIASSTALPPDCLGWFNEQAHCKGYYTYRGSLTTEPYTENVTWIIYPNPITISKQQVSLFRNLQSSHKCEKQTIKKNVRPLQKPNFSHEIIYARAHKPSNS